MSRRIVLRNHTRPRAVTWATTTCEAGTATPSARWRSVSPAHDPPAIAAGRASRSSAAHAPGARSRVKGRPVTSASRESPASRRPAPLSHVSRAWTSITATTSVVASSVASIRSRSSLARRSVVTSRSTARTVTWGASDGRARRRPRTSARRPSGRTRTTSTSSPSRVAPARRKASAHAVAWSGATTCWNQAAASPTAERAAGLASSRRPSASRSKTRSLAVRTSSREAASASARSRRSRASSSSVAAQSAKPARAAASSGCQGRRPLRETTSAPTVKPSRSATGRATRASSPRSNAATPRRMVRTAGASAWGRRTPAAAGASPSAARTRCASTSPSTSHTASASLVMRARWTSRSRRAEDSPGAGDAAATAARRSGSSRGREARSGTCRGTPPACECNLPPGPPTRQGR